MQPYPSGQIPPLTIESRLAYEFVISLSMFTGWQKSQHTYEIGKEWFDTISTRVSPGLSALLKRFAYGLPSCALGPIYPLMGLAYEAPHPGDVPAFLASIETIDALELRLRLFGYYIRSVRREISPEIIRRATEGNSEAQQRYSLLAFPNDPLSQAALRHLLSLDAPQTKQILLDLLQHWYEEVFRDLEQEVLPILERDIVTKRELQQAVSPDHFIELATNGYEYNPEPYIQRILLMPTFLGRPYILPLEHHDLKLISYPVADESINQQSDAPPARLLRLIKALSDERRLRALKKLSLKSYTLQELADEFGIGKSTMHHHMTILRAAGLVRVSTSASDKRYSLREDIIPHTSELLTAYLKRNPT